MDVTRIAEAFTGDSDPASMRAVYLRRLGRLLGLRRKHEQELNQQGLRLLDRAIFAAYCACRDAGVEERAREVLRTANVTLQPPIGQLPLEPEADTPGQLDWGALRRARREA